jgi:hypothetical protein
VNDVRSAPLRRLAAVLVGGVFLLGVACGGGRATHQNGQLVATASTLAPDVSDCLLFTKGQSAMSPDGVSAYNICMEKHGVVEDKQCGTVLFDRMQAAAAWRYAGAKDQEEKAEVLGHELGCAWAKGFVIKDGHVVGSRTP